MLFILFALAFIQSSQCYKGVLLFHGIGPSLQMVRLQSEIQKKHPGTDVVIAAYETELLTLTTNLWDVVFKTYNSQNVTDFLARNMNSTFHIVAASQGSIVSRATIEYYGIAVENYISLAGVHMGQYGIPEVSPTLDDLGLGTLDGKSKEDLYLTMYNPVGQKTFTVAGFWRDPYHYQSYLDNWKFLPVINNEVTHVNSTRFKNNLIAIKKMYLFDGPNDGGVFPWQSGHFGSVECNGTVTEMMDHRIFKEDLIGLRTLVEREAFFHEEVPGVTHVEFLTNLTFLDEKILPLLT